jgi:FkbM family methyltransferase
MEILGQLSQVLNHLRQQGRFLSIHGCIHIGAHEGQEYPLYKHLNINNLLFYEALPDNFKKLQDTVKGDTLIDIRNIALGNTSGTVEMHLEDRGLSSSVLKPKHHLEQYPQITFEEKATVNITRLDDEQFDRSKYNFINIDVQGYEIEVFKGATETLKHIDLIITEINKEEMYEECALVEDVDAFLSTHGFVRIATYWQQDGGTWGDGLYLKTSQGPQ